MTGPEHYKEAERLTVGARDLPIEDATVGDRRMLLAAAQVHATLALAAATVSSERAVPPAPPEWDGGPAYPGNAWGRAIFPEVTA